MGFITRKLGIWIDICKSFCVGWILGERFWPSIPHVSLKSATIEYGYSVEKYLLKKFCSFVLEHIIIVASVSWQYFCPGVSHYEMGINHPGYLALISIVLHSQILGNITSQKLVAKTKMGINQPVSAKRIEKFYLNKYGWFLNSLLLTKNWAEFMAGCQCAVLFTSFWELNLKHFH